MFLKNLFKPDPVEIINKTIRVAFAERNYIGSLYKSLSSKGEIESFIFNAIYSWLYLQDNSLIKMTETNAELFTARWMSVIEAHTSSLNVEKYFELYQSRYVHYKGELSNTRKTEFSSTPYFQEYFYLRLYRYSLLNSEIPVEEQYQIDQFYDKHMLSDIFKNNVNHIQSALEKELKK